jgi:hypothetical protein
MRFLSELNKGNHGVLVILKKEIPSYEDKTVGAHGKARFTVPREGNEGIDISDVYALIPLGPSMAGLFNSCMEEDLFPHPLDLDDCVIGQDLEDDSSEVLYLKTGEISSTAEQGISCISLKIDNKIVKIEGSIPGGVRKDGIVVLQKKEDSEDTSWRECLADPFNKLDLLDILEC